MIDARHVLPICAAGLLVFAWPGGVGARRVSAPIPAVVLTSSVSVHKVVALTFDDGPSIYTPQILALLRKFNVRATFFLIGLHVAQFRDLARQEARDGDAIGNHTYSHVDLEWLSSPEVLRQMRRAQDQIAAATGAAAHWFRPPYGAVDSRIAALAASQGMHTVTWSVDPRDWTLPGWNVIVARVLNSVRPGSIVIMHDGGGPRLETVTALAELLPALRAQGYRFITLDEMFFPNAPVPKRKSDSRG